MGLDRQAKKLKLAVKGSGGYTVRFGLVWFGLWVGPIERNIRVRGGIQTFKNV